MHGIAASRRRIAAATCGLAPATAANLNGGGRRPGRIPAVRQANRRSVVARGVTPTPSAAELRGEDRPVRSFIALPNVRLGRQGRESPRSGLPGLTDRQSQIEHH